MKSLFINLHGDTNMTAAYLHSLVDKAGFDVTTIHFRRYLAEVNKPTYLIINGIKNILIYLPRWLVLLIKWKISIIL